ncbi:MAG: colanic acid biosynthesis glycosyltransferase WcaL, partial [Pseudomonadota bacterium]|nr:colanic acid biosynthesis glycosyltransferase WcaL [Pseudomonadota bacterium]
LVAPGAPGELSDALEALIRAPDDRARLGEAGYRRVTRDFSHRTGLAELARRFGLKTPRPDRNAA